MPIDRCAEALVLLKETLPHVEARYDAFARAGYAEAAAETGQLLLRIKLILREQAAREKQLVDGAAVEAAMMAAWTHNLRGEPKRAAEALERAAAMLRGEEA